MSATGVYVGKDIEVLVTERYELAFRRSRDGGFLEATLMRGASHDGGVPDRQCVGVCRTAPATEPGSKPAEWSYAFVGDGGTYTSDNAALELLKARAFSLTARRQGAFNVEFPDGQRYEANLCETFTEEALHPECLPVSKSTVGECLHRWSIGVAEIPSGVEIITPSHMYIFCIDPEIVYCRAARYDAFDQGVVFDQNFRQQRWQAYADAFMISDNTAAASVLPVQENIFDPSACVWKGLTVYWSVASVKDDLILLNGCGGETYYWRMPRRGEARRLPVGAEG